MILKVEKQRAAHVMNTESSNAIALLTKSHVFNNRNGQGGRDVPQAKLGYNAGHFLLTPKEFLHQKECIRDQKKPFKTRSINNVNTVG